jgi:hypothetical protein
MRAALPILTAVLLLGACGPSQDATTAGTGPSRKARGDTPPVPPDSTKVTAFSVDIENLNVDKIAMRDGGIQPDGNRDHVFRATVDGPADALYIVTTSDKGDPHYGFRADTIVGHEELPSELGNVVDIGKLTVWIAVVENGKFINSEGGTLGNLPPGPHQLKLYVPNTGNLTPGSHLRLYARAPNGGLAKGPVISY